MSNFKLKYIFILSILTIFLDGFMFRIGPVELKLFNIFCIIPFLILLIKYKTKFYKILLYIYRYTPFKYLVWFLFWVFISSTLLYILGVAKLLIYYSLFVKLLPVVLFPYLCVPFISPRIIKIRALVKFIMNIFIFICASGLILYLGDAFSISFLQHCQDFVSNVHLVRDGVQDMIDHSSNSYRLRGIFHEPGAIAGCCFIFMPIIYNICLSKNMLFKDAMFDRIVKCCILLGVWSVIILAQSPIMFAFCVLFNLVYFYNKNKKKKLKLFTILVVVLLIIFLLISIIGITSSSFFTSTFLNRIINVFSARSL